MAKDSKPPTLMCSSSEWLGSILSTNVLPAYHYWHSLLPEESEYMVRPSNDRKLHYSRAKPIQLQIQDRIDSGWPAVTMIPMR